MTGFIAAADDPVEISAYLWDGFSGGLAFEVGANCGRSLPLMMSRFTRVVAFEPYPAACEIARQVPGADVRCIAVSDYEGEAAFRLHRDQFMSAGHEAYQRPDPAERVTEWETVTAPCTTLDTVAAQEGIPDFINVDVEGHELEVLHGATGIINGERPPAWLIEFHSETLHDACVTCLETAGYAVKTARHPHYAFRSVNYYQHGWLRAHPRGHG
jgi:FkbM family methyltransferase